LQDSNKRLVQTLKVNGEVLDNIHEEFKTILSKCNIKVHSFQEAKGISGMKGLDSKVRESLQWRQIPRPHGGAETNALYR
jgi:hypothetical protein